MSATSSSLNRRCFLASSAAVGVASLFPAATRAATQAAIQDGAIRPFHIDVPEEVLVDLRRRVLAMQWPERETVVDGSQGVQLATIQKLAHYWATDYDWRKVEAQLNALPQFITEIDGLDIHFIHVRSKHENALPLIVTHGWPGSVIEQLKIVDPLTNPTAHGASASDAFDLVIPSMPGYGFSGKPTTTGWDPVRIARAWIVLTKRLGYTQFVAQGGDWGDAVTEHMALLGCSAFTPTCRPLFQPTLQRRSSSAVNRHPASQPTNGTRMTSWTSSIGTAWATPSRWQTARRRCTGSRIHPSASQRGYSITTRAVTSS
jgi:hypothetical protein